MNDPLVSAPSTPLESGNQAARILRDRQRSIDLLRDSASGGGRSFGSARKLVQVFNGGMMPAATNRFFATHPVEMNGSEDEGSTGAPVVDTSTILFVDVLGTQAPSVGDLLTAYSVGGRWVSERGGKCCCCIWVCPDPTLHSPTTINCVDSVLGPVTLARVQCANSALTSSSPAEYCLWKGSLEIDYKGANGCPSVSGFQVNYYVGLYSVTNTGVNVFAFWMNWNIVYSGTGTPKAMDYCPNPGTPYPFSAYFNQMANSNTKQVLTCSAGTPWSQNITQTFTPTVNPSQAWNTIFYDLYGGDGTNPVSVTWSLSQGSSGPPCKSPVAIVYGCNSIPYTGVTLNFYTSQGGTLVASCPVDSNAEVSSTCVPYGTYWVTVSGASNRFAPYGQTLTLDCFSVKAITLQPSANYVCVPLAGDGFGCLLPLAKVLNGTDTVLGMFVLNYVEGSSPPTWTGNSTYSFPGWDLGGLSCPAVEVPLLWTFIPSQFYLTPQWSGSFAKPTCPSGAAADVPEINTFFNDLGTGYTFNGTIFFGCGCGVIGVPCALQGQSWTSLVQDPDLGDYNCPPTFQFSQGLNVAVQDVFRECSTVQSLYTNWGVPGTVITTQVVTE